jgi:hypothetical protein
MKLYIQLCITALLAATVASCDPPTIEAGDESRAIETPVTTARGHQNNLECIANFEEFCGGWTIYQRHPDLTTHVEVFDRFVIGKISSGSDPNLWLFPRDKPVGTGMNLADRWNGTTKVKLWDKSTDTDKCLVGVIRVKNHGGTGTLTHHSITVRADSIERTADIGTEDDVSLCFKEQNNSSVPDMCTPVGECPDNDGGLDHGGRAHAVD